MTGRLVIKQKRPTKAVGMRDIDAAIEESYEVAARDS